MSFRLNGGKKVYRYAWLLCYVLLVFIILSPVTAFGATLRVPGSYATIQAAIDAASAGDIVLVAAGTYTGLGNTNLNYKGKAITIQSQNGPDYSIIDCANEVATTGFFFITFEGQDSVLSGFTITRCSLSGIYIGTGSPTISNCSIKGNTGNYGAGIYISLSSATIKNCTISENKAMYGGGVYSGVSPATITKCNINDNSAIFHGGGIYSESSALTITNSIISGNTANRGGGIDSYSYGSSTPAIINSTISNNISYSVGGGIHHSSYSYPLTVRNSIFWADTPDEIKVEGLATVTYSDVQGGYPGAGNLNADPVFVGSGDYNLRTGSPCIDRGTSTGAPQDDINGNPRPLGLGYDMGAYEYSGAFPATISGTVYQSDGLTPITGEWVFISAYTGDPCGSHQYHSGASISRSDGTYTITGVPPGTYYLEAYPYPTTNYISEWWASPSSTASCGDAQVVEISTPGQAVTGKNFQLDLAGSISGTVYQSNGTTPVTGAGINIAAYQGNPCSSYQWVASTVSNQADGTYVLKGLPPGTYYLRSSNTAQSNYLNEWWASPSSTAICGDAQVVEISTQGQAVTGKTFQLDLAGSISGTVYQSNGTMPVIGVGIYIDVYQGNPCSSYQWVASTVSNQADGTYVLKNLPPGTYYLCSDNRRQSDYVNEWWASPSSTADCGGAQAVVISSPGQTITGKNFQLDLGGSISGQVIGDNGPIKGMLVRAYSGRCWSGWLGAAQTDENGNYLIERLPPIPVYVVVQAENSHLNYVAEWQNDAIDCQAATPVTIVSGENQFDVYFGLSRGPKRLRGYEVVVGNGDLTAFFGVEPAFRDGLVKATLTTPNAARGNGGIYTFDLAKDKLLWTSECRYLDGWIKAFGPVEPADYGTYTFTLQFRDGAQETYTYPIQDVPITAVSDISVTVNDSGSVRVTWSRNTTSDGYYEVRVRDLSGGTEIFRSQTYKNIQEMNIPASSLNCLEIGKTYRWLVRVYDNTYPFYYSKSATQYVELPYSPGNFINRYAYAYALKRPGGLLLEFSTRSGSRKNVKSIVVTGPNGFNYSFDLLNDWYDMSTETRLSLKGWYKQDPAWPVTDGTYTFNVQYDDDFDGDTDQTEVITWQLTVNTMKLFSADTLGALIYADGAMGFSWGLTGIPGLRYQVRIRSLDDTEEYYSSYSFIDGTSLTANFADLRAMKRGEMYQWVVRAYSADWDTMEQSASQQFYYDPAPVYDVTEATFNTNSAAITYPYTSSRVGDKLIYTGTGTFAGFGRYIEALAIEQVEGVNCLKVLVKGAGHNPDPELDPEWYHLWLAKDTQGNVWLLQAYDGQNAKIMFSGLAQATIWMPASPVVGQVFRQIGDQYTQLGKSGLEVSLSTGLGPYDNCLKLIENRLGDLDVMYLAPGIGIVKEEWNDGGTNNGWQLQQIIRARAFKDELILNFGAAYGLYHYDKPGGWKQWNGVNPSQMVTIDLNGDGTDELVAAFPGYGLYTYDSTNGWQLINTLIPEFMGAGRNKRIACDFGATYGLWLWDLAGGWRQINTVDPGKMIAADIDGDGEDELVAGFNGYGLYYYDVPGVWTKINALIPNAMVPYSNGVVCDFGAANGLWSYSKSGGWSQLNAADPDKVVAVDIDNDSQDELVVSFVGYGLYTYEPVGSIWVQINTVIPENMILQGNGIAVDFGAAYGLWTWSQGGGWQQRNTVDPGQMTVVDIDNDGVEELVVSFSGYGLYYLDEINGWQLLNTVLPVGMKPINFYP